MIIGIDEAGDFKNGSYGIFIAVFIRLKYSQNLHDVFRKWEKTLPKSCRLHNGQIEVKGRLLPEEQLHSFVTNIMFNKIYQIRYSCYGVEITNETLRSAQFQKDLTSQQIRESIEELKLKGKKIYKAIKSL